jgi:hypothetical protein
MGPELVLTHSEWAAFLAGVKHGEADPKSIDDGRRA